MKHILNTLYVTQPKSLLSREGETVVVEREGIKVIQLPIHTLGQIVCFGFGIIVTPPLMELCSEKGIGIAWLSENGKFLGRVEGPVKGNVLLRREQHRWADNPNKTLDVARCMVAAKVNNGRLNLLRFMRNQPEHKHSEVIRGQCERMARLLGDVEKAGDIETLRGFEGEAANRYFDVFDHMIVQQKEDFIFNGRSRRPPKDKVNAMLSFVYTLLAIDARSALETVGLDPYVGFLHADRPGRPGLALDLMEEFRATVGDRLVLSMINLKQMQKSDFETAGVEEIRMTESGRKTLITAYQNRKKESIMHPFLNENMEIGLSFQVQARLLARHIRGDIDFYPAFIWK